MPTAFLRLLTTPVPDKHQRLREQVQALNVGQTPGDTFTADPLDFALIPEAPFAYWLDHETRQQLHGFPPLEPTAAEVRVGLQTGDDPQFVRAIWEVSSEDFCFCYYPSDGSKFCRFDDLIVQAFFARRKTGRRKWAFHIKSGSSQPWFSPLQLAVNWEDDGERVKDFVRSKGYSASKWVQNERYYFRPGFSWTLRSTRLIPHLISSNNISSVSRYQAYPNNGEEFTTIALAASNVASAFARFFGEKFEFPKFLVETLKALPWAEGLAELKDELSTHVAQEVARRRDVYSHIEPYQEFCFPALAVGRILSESDLAYNPRSLLGPELERKIARAYGLTDEQLAELERDTLEAIELQARKKNKVAPPEADETEGDDESEEDADEQKAVLDFSPVSEWARVVLYAVGVVFGRWDVRLALDPSLRPAPQGPFDPLPVCPPGMLIGPLGLPAHPDRIVSTEWLRARPSAITLPPASFQGSPLIADSAYPVSLAWRGVLPDDETHPTDDIVRRVEDVLRLLFKDRYDERLREMCSALQVNNLREYFRDLKAGFFAFHVSSYSIKQGRRKAPIYWPLQAAGKRPYILWVYAHRYNRDTLYWGAEYARLAARRAEQDLESARADSAKAIGGKAAQRQAEKNVASLEARAQDLRAFEDKLVTIANWVLDPTLDDGVVLNTAPLHELMRWPPAKAHWNDLLKGKHAWSHVAQQLKSKGIIK